MQETGVGENVANCVHHWIIDSPIGDTSAGVCRHCGARRFFYNSYEPKFAIHRKDAAAAKTLQEKAV